MVAHSIDPLLVQRWVDVANAVLESLNCVKDVDIDVLVVLVVNFHPEDLKHQTKPNCPDTKEDHEGSNLIHAGKQELHQHREVFIVLE